MTQVGDGGLPDRAGVVGKRDSVIENPRRLVLSRDPSPLDASSGAKRWCEQLVEQLPAASPQRDELDTLLNQAIQVRVGRRPRVEGQFLWESAVTQGRAIA
jgi:hypothetical protein